MALFESHPDRQTLLENRLLNSWSIVVPQGAGRGDKFLQEVERVMATFELIETTVKRQELETLKTDLKKANGIRQCLHITSKVVPINQYDTFIAVQDFGKHLILSQYVAGQPTGVKSVLEKELAGAFFSFVNAARDAAVDVLAKELNQDLSKINRGQQNAVFEIV